MINQFTGKYRFLSNFYKSPIRYNGELYSTAEHLYQALKTLDDSEREAIRLANSPAEAKKLGKKVTLRPDWEDIKESIMFEVLWYKFGQNRHLIDELRLTGYHPLIEGNYWHDNYWGSCGCPNCANKPGQNRLGESLMKLREFLRK